VSSKRLNVGPRLFLSSYKAKQNLQNFLRKFGYELHRIEKPDRKWQWVRRHNIATVFDVGANVGQFSAAIFSVLPEARVYAFEPLSDCYKLLCRKFQGNAKFKAFNVALSNTNGEAQIHCNAFSPSSSLLQMAELHQQAFPYAAATTLETVQTRTLSSLVDDLVLKPEILIKVDVQGYEAKVLEGAESLIDHIRVAIIETSFHELYHGQVLFEGIYNYFVTRGFRFDGCMDVVHNPSDGSVLQADSIFIRT
jgi:FkbM family methyltransferase